MKDKVKTGQNKNEAESKRQGEGKRRGVVGKKVKKKTLIAEFERRLQLVSWDSCHGRWHGALRRKTRRKE